MKGTIGQEGNADGVTEPLDRTFQSDRKEGDEDEVRRLSLDAVKKAEVLPHALVDGIDGAPPHEFVQGKEAGK